MPTRIFLVDKAGKIRRFPSSRFARLYERNGSESLPEHAGEWVHFAEVIVRLENRQPVRILNTCYIRIPFSQYCPEANPP